MGPSPKTPTPLPAPAPPTPLDPAVLAARRRAKQRNPSLRGQTVLTGPMGIARRGPIGVPRLGVAGAPTLSQPTVAGASPPAATPQSVEG